MITANTPVVCAGLLGKVCKTIILASYAKVPPFGQIGKGKLTEGQVLATAVCDDCARKYPKTVGAPRMYPLLAALAQVRRTAPVASLGDVLQQSSLLRESRANAASRAQNEKDQRRRQSARQATRFIDAAQRSAA